MGSRTERKNRQTALKNIELGIGIAALTKEQRSANTKALYEGEMVKVNA